MAKNFEILKYPKFIERILSYFRRLKLALYKKKKIKKEKELGSRNYHLKFRVEIEDPINPRVFKDELEMVIPAKASFFAKRRVENSIKEKIKLSFISVESISEEDFESFEDSKEKYIKKKGL